MRVKTLRKSAPMQVIWFAACIALNEQPVLRAKVCGSGYRGAAATDPNDPANQPAHGSDVFIGGIPKELTDEQLREFASPAGEVRALHRLHGRQRQAVLLAVLLHAGIVPKPRRTAAVMRR